MVPGHRAASVEARICIHLIPTPLLFSSPLTAIPHVHKPVCPSAPSASKQPGASLKAAFIWGQEQGQWKVSGRVMAWGGSPLDSDQLCDLGQVNSPPWSSSSVKLVLKQWLGNCFEQQNPLLQNEITNEPQMTQIKKRLLWLILACGVGRAKS